MRRYRVKACGHRGYMPFRAYKNFKREERPFIFPHLKIKYYLKSGKSRVVSHKKIFMKIFKIF